MRAASELPMTLILTSIFVLDFCCVPHPGMTPLNMACNRRKSAIAKMFIAANAIVNLADAKGSLPLHYIARCGDLHVARLLLSAGTINSLDNSVA